MEKNKYTLITIIALLTVILPLTIYGTYKHIMLTTNFQRQFKYNGKLWFYDGKSLIGTYTCQSKECDYATYKDGTKAKVIRNTFVFLNDNGKTLLYKIKSKAVIGKYDMVDADMANNNYFIMKAKDDEELWGALEITGDVVNKINPKYPNLRYLNGKYITRINDENIILNVEVPGQETEVFNTIYEIKNLNDNYIIAEYQSSSCPTCEDIIIRELLFDYNNNSYFKTRDISEISFVEDYFLIKEDNNYSLFKIDENKNEQYIDNFYYDGTEKITYLVNENGSIEFYAGSELQKTIEIANEE